LLDPEQVAALEAQEIARLLRDQLKARQDLDREGSQGAQEYVQIQGERLSAIATMVAVESAAVSRHLARWTVVLACATTVLALATVVLAAVTALQ
jgi:hypothetical protein